LTEIITPAGEIVPVPATRPDLLSAAPVADVVALQRMFHDLCVALLDESDYQAISGKRYKKKSAWRKLSAAFNVSDTILEKVYYRDEDGRIGRAEVTVRATAPNGRSAEGLGVCSTREPRGFSNPEHDIPATAHTRAKNRAFSDLFGLGEVSAEEMYESSVTSGQGRKRNPPPPRRRDTGGEGPTDASGDAGLAKGVTELEARLMDLDPPYRTAFKDWRRASNMDWPPATLRDFAAMAARIGQLEEEATLDSDTYDG
jgi:hypothetical protein